MRCHIESYINAIFDHDWCYNALTDFDSSGFGAQPCQWRRDDIAVLWLSTISSF